MAALPVVLGLVRFQVTYLLAAGVLIFFILLPGLCLENIFLKSRNYIEKAAFIFTLGIVWNVMVFGAMTAAGLDFQLTWVRWLPVVLIGILCLSAWRLKRGSTRPGPAEPFSAPERLVLALCLLFSSALVFSEGGIILGSDGLAHITTINSVLQIGAFGLVKAHGAEIILNIRLWRNTIQPYLLMVTGASGVEQYLVLTSLIAPFVFCSFYTFSRSLYDNRNFLIVSLLLFSAHFGGFVSNFCHSNYSWYLCWALLFTSTALLLRKLKSESQRGAAVGLILGFSTILVHFNYFLMFLASAAALGLSYLFWVSGLSKKKKSILAVLLLLVIASPAAVFIIGGLSPLRPGQVGDPNLNFRMIRILEGGVIANYKQTFMRWSGLLGTLALLLSPFLWPVRRRTGEAFTQGYLLLSMFLPLVVVFNPGFVMLGYAIFGRTGTYIYRLLFWCPYISVMAYFLSDLYSKRKTLNLAHGRMWRRILAGAVIVCALPVFAYHVLHYLPPNAARLIQDPIAAVIPMRRVPYRYDHKALMRAISYIRANIEPGEKIASDPITTIMIRAATKNPTLDSAVDPNVIPKTWSFRILSPSVGKKETIWRLRRTKTDYVLVNTTFTDQILADYFSMDAKSEGGRIFLKKFLDNPKLFKLVYDKDGIFIFRVH